MRKRILLTLVCVPYLLFVLTIFSSPALGVTPSPNWPKTISIGTAGVGNAQYNLAVGMANLIAKYAGVKAVPEASSVGGRTIHQLNNKEIEVAFSFADQAYDAARGLRDYKKFGPMNVRQMWMGAPTPFAMIIHADSGIKTFTDLKGKRVMSRYSGNLTFGRVMDLFLEAEGMAIEDVKHIAFTGWKDGTSALKEKRIDTFIHPFPTSGMPSWIQELSLEIPVRLVTVQEKKLDSLLTKYRFLSKCSLSAKDYGPIIYNKDLMAVSPYNAVFCRADLPEDLVFAVMKAVFDHLEEIYPLHKLVKEWTDDPLYPGVVPYSPGVIRYWKEKGRWTGELDNLQKQFLIEVGESK